MDDAKKILKSLYDIGDKAGSTTIDRMKKKVTEDYERGMSAKELELDLKSPYRAADKAKKTDAFKADVNKDKPKDLEPISPDMGEDKTPAGTIKKATGGGLGCGAAMRGFGAVRKK